jgi:hypothetical protein
MKYPPIFVLTTSSPIGRERCAALIQNFETMGISKTDIQFIDFPFQKLENDGSVTDLFSILNHTSKDQTSRAIYNNHVSLIRLAHHYGWDEIVIFEDDARFHTKIASESWERCAKWKYENQDWDVFYYGYCQWPVLFSVPVRWDILRLSSPLTTHAYSIHKRGIRKLVAHLDKYPECRSQHIDKILSVLPLRKYGIFPMISFQSEDPALYRKAIGMLPVLRSVSFGSVCVFSEYASLLWLVCLVVVLSLVVYRRTR